MKSAVVVLALLLVIGSSLAQHPEPDVRPFTEFTGNGIEVKDYEFTVSGYKYTILSRGQGKREREKGSSRRFNLRLRKDDFLDRLIYYAEYRGDVLLICETTTGDYGSGFITRLDGRTLAMKWKRAIPGFNVGPGLLEGNHAYVTAIGFVAKVNLDTGAYAWKHGNLFVNYQKTGRSGDDDFNIFELPKVEGDAVLFTEQDIYRNPPQTLRVNKRTGKIISKTTAFAHFDAANKNPKNSRQEKTKKLRERAVDRDVEIDGPSGCDVGGVTLDGLSKASNAIVYGKINGFRSFFDESSPAEAGDYITTEYSIEVIRVLKDTTRAYARSPSEPPAILTTPLKLARNGGVVMVNGHRASVRVKDFEELSSGKQYVFFLNWSPDYKAYVLTNCALGAILVKDDLQLKSLGNSKELRAELTDLMLQDLFKRIE